MAKMSGITGKLQGKYGNAVFRVRRGVQVMAQYNPVVDNPNTDKQVSARSRWKLISQLAAIYAEIIAIPREGSVTARNLFTQINYKLTSFANNKAQISLPHVQLTKSARAMSPFIVTRSNGSFITAALQEAQEYSRVVWVVVTKNANNQLKVFASQVVDNPDPGTPNTFSANLPYSALACVVYGYGMTDRTNEATAAYNNLSSPTAEQIAALLVSRSVDVANFNLTKTAGAYMEVGSTDALSVEETESSVVVSRPTIGGFSPFAEFTDVYLGTATVGAEIRYTIDGSDPTAASTLFVAAFRVTETTTVKAVAILNGVMSPITTKTFTKQNSGTTAVVPPTINGTTPFQSSTQVTITAEEGAEIFYTTDGTTPDDNSTKYTESFQLTDTTTVKAVAKLQGSLSAVTSKVFTKSTGGSDTE